MAHSSTVEFVTHSAADTGEIGEQLGRLLWPGHVIALSGPLGAGKTCLAQGIARGLGVAEAVTSPTFIIVNQYRTAAGVWLYHIDCYRFQEEGSAEALSIGIDELLDGDGICVVEWAERIKPLLPPEHLRIWLAHAGPSTRHLALLASGPEHTALLQALTSQLLESARPCDSTRAPVAETQHAEP